MCFREGLEYIAGSFNANYKGKNEKNVQVNGNELIFTIKDSWKKQMHDHIYNKD